ncbi:hypothetical protein [Prosthecobacter sp.]|uniref:hypothetical protein n=1 Tax=Prosthecobacter sp. TaxID=1965333 RepID=UPI002ABA4A6E|nr:hypothetical protein [Prosthecobacter sp.]MDZ4401080.1 hypothetical protein [Prosthecobacter sp.]
MQLSFLLSSKLRSDFRAATARRLAAPDAAALPASQLATVRKQWTDAVKDIPYYANLVTSGHAPKELHSWDDLHRLPILSRPLLQDQPESFIRHSGPPDSFMKTAGSTGTPLRLGLNQSERDRMRVVKLAEWQKFGYTPSSRLFLIWGHSHLLGTGLLGRLNHLKRKLADWTLGYRRVDAYRLSRTLCESHARALIRHRPLGLIGYASALDLFARNTTQFRDEFRALGLRFVLATSEPAPSEDSTALIEDLFGCPVVQEYGGAEFGQVAFKNGSAPFEVYSDLNYVECEFSTPDSSGTHPILVTTLYPRYLPLFRYRVGDAVQRPELMTHGHISRFEVLAGRINDVIQFDDGFAVHSVAIFHCIHQEPAVHNIQMIVDDSGIEIRLISTTPDDPALEKRIRGRLAQVHGPLGQARIHFAEDLVTNRAGKRLWFVDRRLKKPVRV